MNQLTPCEACGELRRELYGTADGGPWCCAECATRRHRFYEMVEIARVAEATRAARRAWGPDFHACPPQIAARPAEPWHLWEVV
jgi:hypothetical protein